MTQRPHAAARADGSITELPGPEDTVQLAG